MRLMIYYSFHPGFYRQDTITPRYAVDTTDIPLPENRIQTAVPDTSGSHRQNVSESDSIRSTFHQNQLFQNQITDTILEVKTAVYNPFRKKFNAEENFLTNNALSQIGQKSAVIDTNHSAYVQIATASPSSSGNIRLQARANQTGDWLLLVFAFIVLLFIWIKIFYNKYFSFLANSLISYQLSAKVFREKNVLLKRVSFVLDVSYLIVLSIFLYEFFTFLQLSPARLTSYNMFLLFLNILILFTLIRSIALKLFNYLFKTESIISEYVHNNFIVNKSIGIVLFPIVIAIWYMPENLTVIMLIAGISLLGAGIIFKIIRGYQIIIRKDVLFFYLILYLCTLEILPLLLGYKVFMSLL